MPMPGELGDTASEAAAAEHLAKTLMVLHRERYFESSCWPEGPWAAGLYMPVLGQCAV